VRANAHARGGFTKMRWRPLLCGGRNRTTTKFGKNLPYSKDHHALRGLSPKRVGTLLVDLLVKLSSGSVSTFYDAFTVNLTVG
jgi:hypothetical protein